jgi:hypothetical protein
MAKEKGIVSEVDGHILTYDNGKILPRDWFDSDAPQEIIDEINNRLPEKGYEDQLRAGFARDLKLEAKLNMTLVDPELLK